MVIKEKVKFQKIDENGKKHFTTLEICGRTRVELDGRIEKQIIRMGMKGWELR